MTKDKKSESKSKIGIAKTKTTTRIAKKDSASYVTTVNIDGQTYEQRYYEPVRCYDSIRAQGLKLIAFDGENRILAIRDKNRVDIVNGSLTWEDDTLEDAARREAREEGNVTLGQVALAAVIESNPKGAPPKHITYTLVMAARIKSVDPYQPWHGTHKRVFLTKENLLKRFSAGKAKDLSKLLDMAEFVLNDKPEVVDHMAYIMRNL